MRMAEVCPERVIDDPELRGREGVFRDREQAGRHLASMMADLAQSDALVLAIPAGGVPVAAPLAEELGLELDVAVVSKITLPWNTEAGYGAVAFDGTMRINERLLARLALNEQHVAAGVQKTREKVRRRVRELRGDRPLPEMAGRPVLLVDDGLASGFTMLTAAEAVRKAGAEMLIVAVPTAHEDALHRVLDEVDCVYCANLRGGVRFAVANAYVNWYDVSLDEARGFLV
jgi:putative phosphoribosyl transferase